jgi:MFS family permease
MGEQEPEQQASPAEGCFPPGLHNAYIFAVFNALSYQVVLSSPMVLYAKTLGASATVVGIIAGMMPLLVVFQIPAASHISRFGFKRFVYAGWGTRVMFIFGMAAVPLTGGFWSANGQLILLLVLLFGFNLSRGISSCAWLPWLTELLPARIRGQYLAREAAVTNLSSFFGFLIGSVCLTGNGAPWQFSVLFGFSAVMGAISLRFLKRIPDAPLPDKVRTSKWPVPWLEMLRFTPFRRLLETVVASAIAYGGVSAFSVAWLKTEAGMSEARILLITSISFIGGLCSLWLLGAALDKLGSKPVLTFSFAFWAAVLVGWLLLAGGAVSLSIPLLLLLHLVMGFLIALVQMSNTRLAMTVIPVMGRSHFFAIYSVVNNVVLGVAPILWGILIDLVGPRAPHWLGISWNRYALFFAGASFAFLLALALARRLQEHEAAGMQELFRELIDSPGRFWVRIRQRG